MNDFQKSYSQCGEDIIMLFLIKHVLAMPSVYYLDLGANEATKLNNTNLLYQSGYRGVSVDANPFFKDGFKESRPDDIFVCCGVGTEDSVQPFYEIDPHTLSTFSKTVADSYTKTGNHTLVAQNDCPIYKVDTIIKKFCKNTPNVLSLDVEGLDLDILKSIDYDSWRPIVICVETLTYTEDSSEVKVQSIIDYMSHVGYKLYADTYINSIFVDKNVWEKRK